VDIADIISSEGIDNRELIQKEFSNGLHRLKFSEPLERIFLQYYNYSILNHIRISLIAGLIIFCSFGILDALVFPEIRNKMWTIRYLIISPLLLFVLIYSYYSKTTRYLQLLYSLAIFAVGSGLTAILLITHDESQMYYSGLVLVIIYAYTFTGLRLRYATASSLSVTLIYSLTSVSLIKLQTPMLLNNIFGLFATNIIGIIAGYLLEKYRRKDFLQTILLNIEKKELKETNLRLQRLSYLDSLTNIANRRAFEEAFEKEWNRAQRYSYPLSLLIIDIDHFKLFNDNFGHQAGDNCLVKVATVLKEFGSRPGDIVARYGGEEFAVLLSGTSIEDALRIAEEIRLTIKDLQISNPKASPEGVITLSIGVTGTVPQKGMDRSMIVKRADFALYKAKSEGRNRTVCLEMD